MMKKCIFLLSAVALIFCISCTKEDPVVNTDPTKSVVVPQSGDRFVVSASFGGDNATKTVLDNDGLQPLWQIGDKIAIFNASTGSIDEVLLEVYESDQDAWNKGSITTNGKKCSFALTGGKGEYYLVYPASSLTVNDAKPQIIIPNSTDGSFAKANICIGHISDSDWDFQGEEIQGLGVLYEYSVRFHNVASILRITDKTASINKFTIGQEGKQICGVYNVGLDDSGNAVLNGDPQLSDHDKITVTGMAGEGPYYVAVHPTTLDKGPIAKYYTYLQADETKPDYTKELTGATTLEKNKIYRIGFALPNQKCCGVFSVSNNKKVSFAKGNLNVVVADEAPFGNWFFASNQYDFVDGSGANIGGNYAAMDLFGWSTDGNGATDGYKPWGINYSETNTDYKGNFVDWGSNIEDSGSGWNTLTANEWSWLLGSGSEKPGIGCRKSSTVWDDKNSNGKIDGSEADSKNTENARFVKIQITKKDNSSVYGLLIFPDIFKWTSKMGDIPTGINKSNLTWANANTYTYAQFAAMENVGCVFLPSASYRNGETYTSSKEGHYWSDTPGTEENGKQMVFDKDRVTVKGTERKNGLSVRLVHE